MMGDMTDHRHDELEQRIGKLEQTVSIYGDVLDDLRNRVYALEHDTPQARRLQRELDEARADFPDIYGPEYGEPDD